MFIFEVQNNSAWEYRYHPPQRPHGIPYTTQNQRELDWDSEVYINPHITFLSYIHANMYHKLSEAKVI